MSWVLSKVMRHQTRFELEVVDILGFGEVFLALLVLVDFEELPPVLLVLQFPHWLFELQ